MSPRRALVVLLAAAACSKTPAFEPFKDPSLGFSLEAPRGWVRDADPAPETRLAATVRFIGDAQPQDEGEPLGAVLTISRLTRRPDEAAAPAAARKAFAERVLAPTRALFADDGPAPAESKPYARDYEHGGPTPLHSGAPVPMRVEGRVFRTHDAYFVVELKGVREKFERHRPVLEKALASFRAP